MLNRTVPTVHDVNQKESLVVGFGVKGGFPEFPKLSNTGRKLICSLRFPEI